MPVKKPKPRVRRNSNTKPRRRPRGGAAMLCPECSSVTRVLRTTRTANDVTRERACRNDHRFTTTEKIHE